MHPIRDPKLVEMMAKAHVLGGEMAALPRQNLGARQFFAVSNAVFPSATIHTYGSWASILDPIPFDVSLWRLDIYDGNLKEGVLDVGLGPTGGSAPTQSIVSVPFNQVGDLGNHYYLPIWLKKGQRLWSKVKSNKASAAESYPDFNFLESLDVNKPLPFQRGTTYGLTNEVGAAVATGTANAQGAWVQLSAATTYPIKKLVICGQLSGTAPTADVLLQIDIGVGASGSQKVLLDQLYFYYILNRTLFPNSYGPIEVNIPAGTNLWIRSIAPNNSSIYTFSGSVIGID